MRSPVVGQDHGGMQFCGIQNFEHACAPGGGRRKLLGSYRVWRRSGDPGVLWLDAVREPPGVALQIVRRLTHEPTLEDVENAGFIMDVQRAVLLRRRGVSWARIRELRSKNGGLYDQPDDPPAKSPLETGDAYRWRCRCGREVGPVRSETLLRRIDAGHGATITLE